MSRDDGVTRPQAVCCERGCEEPVDRPRSRVRCAQHFTEPKYGGRAAPGRPRKSKTT